MTIYLQEIPTIPRIYYVFYKNQEGYRPAVNRHIYSLCFLMVKGAVSNLDIRLSYFQSDLNFLKSLKAYSLFYFHIFYMSAHVLTALDVGLQQL